MDNLTAERFIHELQQHQNEAKIEKMKKFFLKVQMKTRRPWVLTCVRCFKLQNNL